MALVWLGWALSWWGAALWTSRTVQRPGGQGPYRVLTIAGVILLAGFWREPATQFWRPDADWQWALVGAAALGFGLCWWARLYLGRLWSASITRKQDHRVVDTGPYALVRHPIYTGVITAAFASALLRGSWVALAGALVFTLSFTVKARMEEKFLRAELGTEAYDAYAARVAMLIPFVKF